MAVEAVTPPVLMKGLLQLFHGRRRETAVRLIPPSGVEHLDHYANTSLYMLDTLMRLGPLAQMKLLSLGCRTSHVGDYLALFQAVYHNTTVPTYLQVSGAGAGGDLQLLEGDFFELPRLDVDAVTSHATIHCYSDTRYGNPFSASERRPYLVARKLREILPARPTPIVVSVAVNRDEHFADELTHVSHEKFVESFVREGFGLQGHYFDYLSGGWPFSDSNLLPERRRSPTLPESSAADWHYVEGTYFFL